MKRKILIGLIVFSLCLILGGVYINNSIDNVIWKLERIIVLHQAESAREALLGSVKMVQQDLLLKDSPHATVLDAIVGHGEQMGESVDTCFQCHHREKTQKELEALQGEIYLFQGELSRVYTMRANAARRQDEAKTAFSTGQKIIGEINEIIIYSSEKLAARTRTAMDSISETRRLLTLFIILGPIFLISISMYFLKDLANSVDALVRATRKIKGGRLDYKVDGLRGEFSELAGSFNEMAVSLEETMHQIAMSERRYRALFEGAGDAIFILDTEGDDVGKIISANPAAAEIHGYTVEELMNLKIQDLDSAEDAAASPERIRRILDGEWIHAESFHKKKDGTIFPVEISAGPLDYEDQRYILAFDRDITEKKQAEEALQRAEQLVSVGEIAAGLAHEIKNPLAGIKVSIEVLASELELNPEDREIFKRVVNEINRIAILLRNLLSYARPATPHFSRVDINRIIGSAVQNAEIACKSPVKDADANGLRDVRFIKNLSDELPEIVADPAQLQQVVLNLLLNAVHAIETRGTVSVMTSMGLNSSIVVTVSDTGKGIKEEDLEKIFQPFFTTKPKGTGLGLSICKRLIEQQNGQIRVRRNEKAGLTFVITLPVDQGSGVRLS